MSELEVRKPGRASTKSAGIKKGRPTWKPASVLDVANKDDGYRYRWSLKTPENLAKKHSEGWETVSGITSDRASYVDPGRIQDGSQIASTYEKHDCILQRIPEELAQERDAFINAESERRVKGLTAHLKRDMAKEGGGAPVHGDITISSLRGEEKIE